MSESFFVSCLSHLSSLSYHLSPSLPLSPPFITLSSPTFPTGVLNFGSNETFFLNEYQRSYKCNSISIKLKNLTSNNVTNSTEVVLDGLQVQAFEFRRNGTFGNGKSGLSLTFWISVPHSSFLVPHSLFLIPVLSCCILVVVTRVLIITCISFTARECPANQERNIKLPIAVGSLLLLFLTAVIVVYILSRFRKRQLTSYESLN